MAQLRAAISAGKKQRVPDETGAVTGPEATRQSMGTKSKSHAVRAVRHPAGMAWPLASSFQAAV